MHDPVQHNMEKGIIVTHSQTTFHSMQCPHTVMFATVTLHGSRKLTLTLWLANDQLDSSITTHDCRSHGSC